MHFQAKPDKTYFIQHVNSQDHFIDGAWNVMSGSPLQYVTTLTSLVTIAFLMEKM